MMRQLPNLVTGARILLTPWIILDLLQGSYSRALVITLIAGSTDFFDGLIARRVGGISRAGAYLDPVADKLLLTSLYLCFGFADLAPDWLVWLIVGRDVLILTMVAIGLLFTWVKDYPPSLWGKLSTGLQIATVLVILSRCAYPDTVPANAQTAMIGLTGAMTGWSGIHYVWRAIVTLKRGDRTRSAPV